MENLQPDPNEEKKQEVLSVLAALEESISMYRAVQAGLSELDDGAPDADAFCRELLRQKITSSKEYMAEATGDQDFHFKFMFARELVYTPINGRGVEFDDRRYFNAHEIEPAVGGRLKLTDTFEGTELVLPPEAEFRLVLSYSD